MRRIYSRAKTRSVANPETVQLRAYPKEPGPKTPGVIMESSAFSATLNAQRESRRRFGRAISMDAIETALQQAHRGNMRSLTDVLRETVETDPHLGSILNKRFGAVSNLPYEIQPASGVGINRDKALFYAEVVRAQIRNLKAFRKNLGQIAWALFDGRACLELQWLQIQNTVGLPSSPFGTPQLAIQQLDWIHPRRLSFGPQREIRIQPEDAFTGGNFSATGLNVNELPDKFLWWLPQLFGDYPEREGLGIRCMYWSFFKRFTARERMILAELYGKPWRIIEVDEESSAGQPELDAADEIVDSLGSTYTARMPRGTKLNIESPIKGAGQVHADIIKESDQQNSKLVLGQTGTTDGVPAGLNSNQANVMQDEQLGVLIRDAGEISEVIESFLTDRIIALNFGELEVTHAPVFKLRADLPADRTAELKRLQAALDAGLSIGRDEAYELSGFQVPDDKEIVIRMEQPPTPPNSPVAPAVRPTIIYPEGQTPQVGEQQPQAPAAGPGEGESGQGSPVGAADAATTVTVNEDRAARGLPPLTLPTGAPDPRGELTIREFEGMLGEDSEPASEREPGESNGPEVNVPSLGLNRPGDREVCVILTRDGLGDLGVQLKVSRERHRAEWAEWTNWVRGECVHLAPGQNQQSTSNGSPEDFVRKGVRELTAETAKWVRIFEQAVEGENSVTGIFAALNDARSDLEIGKFETILEQRRLQSAMLGVIDSAKEISGIDSDAGEETIEEVSNVTTSNLVGTVLLADTDGDFTKRPFKQALEYFNSLALVSKPIFEQLAAGARAASFTIAGIMGDQMLRVLHDELALSIEAGDDLRRFKKRIRPRLKSAGFIAQIGKLADGSRALNASHVETVFRTNTLNSYNTGRWVHQSSPRVVAAFPVWEIRVVDDDRTRPKHRSLHGVRLLANDPFWERAYPPFGFNCRCRVIVRGRSAVSTVVSASTIRGIPDAGFTSGRPALALE